MLFLVSEFNSRINKKGTRNPPGKKKKKEELKIHGTVVGERNMQVISNSLLRLDKPVI